ncbi:hypothetical protein N7532_009828 [Penicillium argentinense]|uniref:Aminotransferase class I/classII domain-containing protein n=1 Tax=Penicillium argentinense TaxID=1131581 RepID=A0A9W9ENH2_9EURO|nr:uncharacterized protein N7532_009828 [Penicillium argentinense]KAJ5085057.1 hypothetical protein N7532_009828 [Penicillium argentinense]
MLEDQEWTSTFLQRKKKLMIECYNTATDFLFKHGILLYDMNAGLFIWVDLRHLLVSKSSVRNSDYDTLRVMAVDSQRHQQIELKISDICMKNGVMIAPGHVYRAEEYGWFRITFTVGREALDEGLKRLLKSIEEIEAVSDGWKWT